jgi:D-beta-D-heptose 7-phosphate kinase/D-beta-D-heptose 1-phosphate adenosyltransferase
MTKAKLEKIFSRFSKCQILVVGDLMLDRYLIGNVSRISPEAPVPVVDINKEEHLLGGAANVAKNIAALSGNAKLVGVIGNDSFGKILKKLLKSHGFSDDSIFIDSNRPTTVKTRIIAHNQQIVRADREKSAPIPDSLNRKLLDNINKLLPKTAGVIISDYGKGVINYSLLSTLIQSCNERKIFVSVDPKETHFFNYRKVGTITPNHHEAGFVAGQKITDDKSLLSVGWRLLEQLQARSILITLGEKGMALFENDSRAPEGKVLTRIPAMARKVFDVTGAGDTVIATMTLAVAAGANLKEAAFIANVAAGEVVGEIGTAQVSKNRLRELVLERLKDSHL